MKRLMSSRGVTKKKQAGATMWTTLSVVIMLGFIAMIAFKLIPVYIDHGIIRGSMQGIVDQRGFREMTHTQILTSMRKRMQVDNIQGFDKDAFKVSRDKSGDRYIVINYAEKVPMMGNVYALVEFQEEIRARR